MSYPTYLETLDAKTILADYPLGEDFLTKYRKISQDELYQLQNRRFLRCLQRAWQLPFYQRHWGKAGIEVNDIQSLDDISKLPPYSKEDLMQSVAEYPPLGDFHGWDVGEAESQLPMIFHTTSGTTGKPQPLFFSPKSREIQSILLARLYRFQGLLPKEVVHSVYGHGMINGGHYVREAVTHYTNALFMSAGTGVETRSIQQVQLMKDFSANVVVGFADYIKKLAEVAKQQGLTPGVDIPVRMISGHMGRESRQSISEIWGGAEIFDWYGVGDTGAIAGEGPDHDGLYVMEDAQYVEVCDIDSHQPVEDGETGDMIVTCLYKDDIYPIIRFNTHDVTRVITRPSNLDLNFKRIEGFLGRSDNMVKIRGINIYPQAIGPVLEKFADFSGEFICVAARDSSGRDEVTVKIETHAAIQDNSLCQQYQQLLKQNFGVEMTVELVSPGELMSLTGIETRQKPIRLIDNRFKS